MGGGRLCRWMAPEVIEHAPYNEKADVFSFGVLLWEMLTGKVPYAEMTPLQAAVGVVQKGLRPTLPTTCPPALASLIRSCWHRSPHERPPFSQLKVCTAREGAEDLCWTRVQRRDALIPAHHSNPWVAWQRA